jgi:hypothetical protein
VSNKDRDYAMGALKIAHMRRADAAGDPARMTHARLADCLLRATICDISPLIREAASRLRTHPEEQ